jgi:hypothetical protein
MKKQKFLLVLTFSINTMLFQDGFIQKNVNQYLHLTLAKKLKNILIISY